jgi:putative redox protein
MDLITVTRRSGLEFSIRLRGHELATDMSPEEGGTDAGLNPVELLGAALGGCLGIMVQRYCDEHGFPGDVAVSLTMEMAADPKRVAGLVADVELPASVPDQAREEIRTLIGQFPVPATFEGRPGVAVEIV